MSINLVPDPPVTDSTGTPLSCQLEPVYPRYSFVQNGDPYTEGCNGDPKFCLPLSDPANLRFEVKLNNMNCFSFTPDYTNDNFFAVPVPCDFVCAPTEQTPSITTGTGFEGTFTDHHDLISLLPFALIVAEHERLPIGSDVNIYFDTVPFAQTTGAVFAPTFDSRSSLGVPYTVGGYTVVSVTGHDSIRPLPPSAPVDILTTIEVGQCFKLQLIYEHLDGPGGNVLYRQFIDGCTNCFIRTVPDECYTSVISYRNPTDTFGFTYFNTSTFNIIELPVYLRDPVMENDQKVYTKSDGSVVKLYERKEEKYTLETDLMPYIWHKALDIALSHDTVTITNPNASSFDPVNTATQFVKSDNYQIEYMKAPLSSLGKGTCKLINATPVNLINNNCG